MAKMKKISAVLIAAGAAAAAGYYFYKSRNAKRHRDAASKWARDFKKEVEKQLQKLPDIQEAAVSAAVDSAKAIYRRRGKYRTELEHLGRELKKNWRKLRDEIA